MSKITINPEHLKLLNKEYEKLKYIPGVISVELIIEETEEVLH